jgi:hypothetical protein
MWRGTMHFRVFQQVPYNGEIQLLDAGGGGGSLYVHKAYNYRKSYVHWILLYLKLNI